MTIHHSHVVPGPRRVVGLDLSLTSTGISDGTVSIAFSTPADACIEYRLADLTQACMMQIASPGTSRHNHGQRADLVVIEGAAYGAKGNAVEQLAALRLMVRTELWRQSIPFAVVPPATLKAYTSGNGRASKPAMVAALAERHELDLKDVKVANGRYDIADAFALAAMGYARIGQPLPTAGRPRLDSMLAVRWPEGI